jgi:SnoaL-like domain
MTSDVSMGDADSIKYMMERLHIGDALARFCYLMDVADHAGAVELFTVDCVTDYGPASGGVIHGRDGFLKRIQASQARFKRTHHQLGQIQVELRGRDATSIAHLASIHITFDGRRVDGFLQYHDSWVKTSDGWKISARRGVAAVVDGDPSEDRLWVHRGGSSTDIQP